jgi:hypothetical protein
LIKEGETDGGSAPTVIGLAPLYWGTPGTGSRSLSRNYVIGDVITSRNLSLISPRSVSIPAREGRENRDPRPALTDFQTCAWGLDFWGTAGTDWSGIGAVAPRRGDPRAAETGPASESENNRINHFNKPSTTLPGPKRLKKTSESSHLYRCGLHTLSPGQSNNSARNNPVHNTIINNQAIPSGMAPCASGSSDDDDDDGHLSLPAFFRARESEECRCCA